MEELLLKECRSYCYILVKESGYQAWESRIGSTRIAQGPKFYVNNTIYHTLMYVGCMCVSLYTP